MKVFLLFLLANIVTALGCYAQGSGYTMSYNGTNNYTTIPHASAFSSHASGEISVEAWIKIDAVNTDSHGQTRQPVVVKGNGGSWEWALYVYSNLRIGFSTWRCSGASHSEINGGSIVLGQWHHIASSFDDNNFNRVYIDGMLVSQGTSFSGTACSAVRPVRIASREDGQYLDGSIDEVRIWDKALTQTEIRDNMCKKLSLPSSNLTAYYRFDEGTDNTCNATEDLCDLSGNGHNGTNVNNPSWNYSGAAIGDESVYYYPGNWTGQSLSISTANRGNFSLNNVTGNPDGIHLYRVFSQPNSVTGMPFGLGSNDTYFGTYVARYPWGGNFQVEYNYGNYLDAISEEPDLEIYERNNNSVLTWSTATSTQSIALDQFSLSSITARKEYVLAAKTGPLPVELNEFNVLQHENHVNLTWSTASELNSSYFQIERSSDGYDWTSIGKVNAAGNSTSGIRYEFDDLDPLVGVAYYRLNQVDIDAKNEYSKVLSVVFKSDDELLIYPNPTKSKVYVVGDSAEKITLYSMKGEAMNMQSIVEAVEKGKITLNFTNVEFGVYFIHSGHKVYKLVLQ